MTTAILLARMGSTRLPGKAMLPLAGKPMLQFLADRVGAARAVDRVAIATSTAPEDDALATLAAELGLECHRGSADDVLGRLLAAAQASGDEQIIEVLGDNAMVHADLIDDVFERFGADRLDYAASLTNEYPHAAAGLRRFALGVRVQVLSVDALTRCAGRAKGARYREHTSAYLAEHPDAFAVGFVEASGRWEALNRPELNLAVNYAENLELLRELVGEDRDPRLPDLPELVRRYDKRPELHAWMGPQPAQSTQCTQSTGGNAR